MSTVGISLTLETTDLKALQEAIGKLFPQADKARILQEALKKAVEPTLQRLRATTPLGPTGNLRRAIDAKVIAYSRTGNAVAVVGFRRAGAGRTRSAAGGSVRAGRDRAFHQYWLELGTKERFVTTLSNKPYGRRGHLRRVPGKPAVEVRPHIVMRGQGGYIASSYNRLGPFKMQQTPRIKGGESGQRVQTDPGYPKAFFKKSRQPIRIPAMPPGGSYGEPPLETAWVQTQATVAEILQRELAVSLETALDSLTRFSTTLERTS